MFCCETLRAADKRMTSAKRMLGEAVHGAVSNIILDQFSSQSGLSFGVMHPSAHSGGTTRLINLCGLDYCVYEWGESP